MIEELKKIFERILPSWAYRIMFDQKYVHFFATGVAGVAINLLTTWLLAEFVFGIENYFTAYLIGIAFNLGFNFVVHTIVTFKAKTHIPQRLVGFIAYSISMSAFQAWIVKMLIPIVGVQFYLLVIAGVIFAFSAVTFLLFKFFLFHNAVEEGRRFPQLLLIAVFSSLVLHLWGVSEVLSTQGIEILVKGDGTGYLELAKNLSQGVGFGRFESGAWTPETFRTPGLPLILVPFASFPYGVHLYLVLQTIAASTILPLLLYAIGKQVFSPRAGMIAAWMIALEPQMMFSSWSPLTEIPFLICVLTAVWLLFSIRVWSHACNACYWIRTSVSGLLFGYAILIRPGTSALVLLFLAGFVIYDLAKKDARRTKSSIATMLIAFAVLIPWQYRNLNLTGEFGLSGTGWWNVYVDYVASIHVVEKGTEFYHERSLRRQKGVQEFGLASEAELKSPEHERSLRDSAIQEILAHAGTALKLESVLVISYFTNDNYYNQLIRLGFISPVPDRASPTQLLLREGLSGVPRILEEMRKQYFVPIVSRLYQFAVLFLAILGLWRTALPARFLLLFIIALSALMSTVLGFGVEVRLRMIIMPALFLLAGYAVSTGLPRLPSIRRMRSHEAHGRHPGL